MDNPSACTVDKPILFTKIGKGCSSLPFPPLSGGEQAVIVCYRFRDRWVQQNVSLPP